MAKKEKQKKTKRGAKKVKAKAKLSAKKKAPKAKAPSKAARRRPSRQTQVVLGSQDVEMVHLKRPARAAAAGAGGGDFSGVSVVESAGPESAEELLEEGQTFEAGIMSGVENASDEGEVRTHETPQDDVPEEYDDKDRP